MRFIFTLILIFSLHSNLLAQREFGVCDSTTYFYNADTSIIVGRTKIYRFTNNNISQLFDFTSNDNKEYIRDFDIINANLWFTVIGSRYIGSPTRLYKSVNKGVSWVEDTAHFKAKNQTGLSSQFLGSINSLQHLNGDTLVMFMHYYESGILYSTDLGKTWTKWFHNLISHYQGMLSCTNKYYIFGYQGDGFKAYMFGFDKNLLFSSDSNGMWSSFNNNSYHPPCYNGNKPSCFYAPYNLNRCSTYQYFVRKVDTLCMNTGIEYARNQNPSIYPNPFKNYLSINNALENDYFQISTIYGNVIWEGFDISSINFDFLEKGLYFLTIKRTNNKFIFKIWKD